MTCCCRKTACGLVTVLIYLLFGCCRDESWTCLCILLTKTPDSLVSRTLPRPLYRSLFRGAAGMLSIDWKSWCGWHLTLP
jgi:hypothetical protein